MPHPIYDASKRLMARRNKAYSKEVIEHVTPPTTAPSPSGLRIIDVSNWQPRIDWSLLGEDAIAGAIVKLGEDGITNYTSRYDQWEMTAAAELLRGGYWFARPDDVSPADSVSAFVRAIDSLGQLHAGDAFALDIESGSGRLDRWVAEWGDLFNRTMGQRALCYSSAHFLGEHRLDIPGVAVQFAGLWDAYWYDNEPRRHETTQAWGLPVMTQYTSTATLQAIPGQVDLSMFWGTREDWLAAPWALQ